MPKGHKQDNPFLAINEFLAVVKAEEEKGEWGFKALKQSVKVSFNLMDYDSALLYYERLLSYTASAVTRNTSEKSINSILDYVSATQDMVLMEKVYSITLDNLQEQDNNRLWTRTTLKLAKLWLEHKEYARLSKIILQLHSVCNNETNDAQKGTLLLEIYALEIQMYTATKNNKKVTEIYHKFIQIKSAIPHPRIMGLIRECVGKMHIYEQEWDTVQKDFFEAFQNYDEAWILKTLDDLPYELKEIILRNCDVISHQRLRACDKLFYSMPAPKTVSFSVYQSWLKKINAEKWEFGSDYEAYDRDFWYTERKQFRNDDLKCVAFQSRVFLDLFSLTKDQFLYVCRNELTFEICRIVKAVLMDSQTYFHVDLFALPSTYMGCYYYSLAFSIVANDVDMFASLLQVEGINPRIGDVNWHLYLACREGTTEIVRKFLQDERVDPSTGHNCAIGAASLNGHVEVVRLLLEDERVDPSADENNAIRAASHHGHFEVVRLLLEDERVDPSAHDNCLIRRASQFGNDDFVRLLLHDERVDPSAHDNDAIVMACQKGHELVVRLLLEDDRVNPSAQENYAIYLASEMGHLEVVRLLLQDERVDPAAKGNRAIRVAYRSGHFEVGKLLLRDLRVIEAGDIDYILLAHHDSLLSFWREDMLKYM